MLDIVKMDVTRILVSIRVQWEELLNAAWQLRFGVD